MLKILKALYCHLPPLSPHHHHQKAANQRRKEIEIDFQNEIPQILEHWEKIKFERKKESILQIQAVTQKSGPQSNSSNIGC